MAPLKLHKGDHVIDAVFFQYLQHMSLATAQSRGLFELTDLTVAIPTHMLMYVNVELEEPTAKALKVTGKGCSTKNAKIKNALGRIMGLPRTEEEQIIDQLPEGWD